ncbi:MAG: GspE/PulE family protein [Planctomycetota bacterium]|jgi:type IV pilus assembly protein PilB
MILSDVEKKLPLGQILVRLGILTEEQLESALDYQRQMDETLLLGEVLVKLGLCTEQQVMESLGGVYGVPYVKLSPRLADPKVLDLLPREFLNKHNVLPLFNVRGRLTLAVNEPANVFVVEEVKRLTNLEVIIVCATGKDIKSMLAAHLPSARVFVIDEILRDEEAGELSALQDRIQDIAGSEMSHDGSPLIKLVNYLIYHAIREAASDIHVEPDENALRVRYRVDGVLYEKLRPPYEMLPGIAARIKNMASMSIAEHPLPREGEIKVLMDNRPVKLRVSTAFTKFGEKIVIRIIDDSNVTINLEKLGFSYEMLKQWRRLIAIPNGILLVSGPRGSGKSTTLYSVLKELNNDEINICTVEDPVKFNLKWVNQLQVDEKIGFTFPSAVRSLLGQDPDVIMISEIRDSETARIAVQSGLAGHRVFSTLYTSDAPGAVKRLIDLGVPPYQISASLVGVLAQRLVRKICTNCKEPYDPPVNIRRAIERSAGQTETFYHGTGCPQCRNTGFAGRIGIYELLVPGDQMRDKIAAALGIDELRALAGESQMVTLRADGMEKVKAGITTVEEVLRVTSAVSGN